MSTHMKMTVTFVEATDLLLEALRDVELPDYARTLCKLLQREIDAKHEVLKRRQAFTDYKSAAFDSPFRNDLRNTYLDLAGISKNFRSEKEISYQDI